MQVILYNIIGSFTNSGNIQATTTGDNATAYGVGARNIGNFKNSGNIIAIATATNGTAEAYGIGAEYIGNFSNSGNIQTTANATDDAEASGIYAGYGIDNFINSGNIEIYVNSSSNNATINAATLRIINSASANITNNGTMKVVLNVPDSADMTNVNATVFYIQDSNATISNYGTTWVKSNVVGSNLRTLYIAGTSNVTLKDKFAITFGAPGVNPDTRPIYVGSGSTLNLNNATLIARGDSRNLKFGVPYYLIENNGTVNGQWGGLEKGYTNSNPDIAVSWYDPTELGENSAVIFGYRPVSPGSVAPVIGGMAGGQTFISSLTGFVFDFSPMSIWMVKSDRKEIMLASAGMSEAGYAGIAPVYPGKGLAWLIPVYTRVNADDLGFDANSYGFALGLGGRFNKNFGAEVYAGYLYNDIDFNVRGAKEENQDLYFGGINLIYAPKPYFAKLMALGYYNNHDYKGYTGLNYDLVEKADYDSYGFRVDLVGGYVIGQKTRVIPKVGLSYAYYNTDSFWTKVPENPDLRRHYDPDSLDVWKLIAGVDLISDFETKGKMGIRAFGGLKIEQAISDNDISTITYAPNQPKYKLEKSIADTTGVLQAGLIFNYDKRWSFEISGKADFNADYQTYTGKAVLRYNF